MKPQFTLLTFILLFSANVSRTFAQTQPNTHSRKTIELTPIIVDNDTMLVHELRLIDIESALDGQVFMYQRFGLWSELLDSKYHDDMVQLVWRDIPLFGDQRTFTVVADGTETENDYYASILVFDEEGRNCLAEDHPYREALKQYFVKGIKRLRVKKGTYGMLRGAGGA